MCIRDSYDNASARTISTVHGDASVHTIRIVHHDNASVHTIRIVQHDNDSARTIRIVHRDNDSARTISTAMGVVVGKKLYRALGVSLRPLLSRPYSV